MTAWIIDQGNTRLKLGVFEGGELVTVLRDEEAFAQVVSGQNRPDHVLVAASGSLSQEWEAVLKTLPTVELGSRLTCGIELDYATPETLGWDRIANTAAATELHGDAVWAIVDAGTCITVDVAAGGTFFGGSIAPGIDLRLRALYAGTASLPLIEAWREHLSSPESTWPDQIGSSTLGSLVAGAWGGARTEIAGRLLEFGKRWPDLKVIWTGGDAEYLHERDSGSIFADSNLTLKGYYAILKRLV